MSQLLFPVSTPVLRAQFESEKGLVHLKLEPISVLGAGSCVRVKILCV